MDPAASTTITAMIRAWKTNAARQLIAEVIRPPSSGPAAAPMPPMARFRTSVMTAGQAPGYCLSSTMRKAHVNSVISCCHFSSWRRAASRSGIA